MIRSYFSPADLAQVPDPQALLRVYDETTGDAHKILRIDTSLPDTVDLHIATSDPGQVDHQGDRAAQLYAVLYAALARATTDWIPDNVLDALDTIARMMSDYEQEKK